MTQTGEGVGGSGLLIAYLACTLFDLTTQKNEVNEDQLCLLFNFWCLVMKCALLKL